MTDRDDEARLVGTYRLRTFRDIADDGEIREPLGSDPAGVIIYSPERWMSAVLSSAERPNFADDDILAGSDDERLQAFSTASAYSGSWQVESGEVVHRLAVATFPNWVGTTQRRPFRLSEDQLWLNPPRLLMNGKMRRSELVWDRL